MLTLLLKSASNLINVDIGINNKSDPYVKATFRGEERKTKHIDNNLNPVWTAEHNNVLEWDLGPDPLVFSDELHVKVKDYERILRKKLLGQVTIPIKDLLRTKDFKIEQTYPLVDSYHKRLVSTLSLKLEYKPPRRMLSYMADEIDAGDEQELVEGEEVRDEEGKVVSTKSGKPSASRFSIRREWSTRKRTFKITVRIHEGRQIPGINISPVARVTIQKNKKETRVKKSTNNPDFNQTFTFNFQHCSEAELFDELIVLEVFDSRQILRNALIGFFESDIGFIYENQDHSIVRKWVLLTGAGLRDDDDDDLKHGLSKFLRRRGRDGGNAGYLKVTITVQGSGDDRLSMKQLEAPIDDEDDIEKNCLTPVGATREPAEFHLKVFMAEDLPQMDAGFVATFRRLFLPGNDKQWDPNQKKKLVDPYFVFSFSGKEVKTKTLYRTNNPSFNQLLRLPVMYPTMSERIKFQLFDKDRGPNENDIIATSFLSMSQISGYESSVFSPHFGPCFINFYGSPREFRFINSENYEKLDNGIGEGVAYRGRALVELTQSWTVGNSPNVHNIHDEDVVRVQPFLRQDKYKLFACFKNAAMISKNDKAIEFEVSIGNFGNKLDETEVACNTPPTNPVYDGSHYHYLPWHHYKPCICLNCHWENIAFRIDPLNIINRLCEQLDAIVTGVKLNMESDEEKEKEGPRQEQPENEEEKKTSTLKIGLQQIIQKCRHAKNYIIVHKNRPPINTLDVTLAVNRQEEIDKTIQEARELFRKLSHATEENVDLKKIVQDMEDYVSRLKSLAYEPQISIPDVIIWMLYGGNRIAYHRVPIQDVMYSPNIDTRGKYCGTTMELLMKYPGNAKLDNEYQEVPAMVRVELWVGLEEHQKDWIRREAQEGVFKIYAETYKNEMKTPIVGWTNHFSLRPQFSNASGDVPLNMKDFVLAKGWEFRGDEKPHLDRSLMYEQDWALSKYTEEIWEHQGRNLLGGEWSNDSQWKEEDGQESGSPDDFQIRPGWKWTDKWRVDRNRAVDAEGWEYCISEGLDGIYVKASKALHMTRRRRWVRTRELEDASRKRTHEKFKKQTEEGWEYAATFDSKFHINERTRDLVRRKRLLKEIVPQSGRKIENLGLPPRLAIDVKRAKLKKSKTKLNGKESQTSQEDSEEMEMRGCLAVNPRMFIVYERPHKFQLWVYIYQGRSLLAKDDSGESDPYVQVAFCNQSQRTEWKRQTLAPKWDQMLIFPHVELFETMENIIHSPPKINMEVFDRDPVGKHDFIGRCMVTPVVQTKGGSSEPPSLTWISLNSRASNAGQILATAELFLDEGQQMPSLPKPRGSVKSHYIYPVRKGVSPELQRVAVEILCWGVRNLEPYNFRNVDQPSVKFEWGNKTISSEKLENAKQNPNFSKPVLEREILIIEKGHFAPAMEIRVYDNRKFSMKPPLVGVVTVPSIEMSNPATLDFYDEPASPFSPFPTTQQRRIEEHKKGKEQFDWWSKYYYSVETKRLTKQIKWDSKILSMFSNEDDKTKDHLAIYRERKYDSIEIFDRELEKVEEFEGLNDFVKTFKLKRGKWKGEDEDEDDVVGELKANIRVYPVENDSKDHLPPGLFSNLSEVNMKWPIKCVVRVYVICAFDLQAHDANTGLADPFLSVTVGNNTQTSKEVQHNTLNPIFGEMFEFTASIPIVKDLKIKVIDQDALLDEDIGETTIDLEQRLLSRYHASCGLPKLYYVGGPFAWRDCKTPKDILKEYCHATGCEMKFYPPKSTKRPPNTLVLNQPKNSTAKPIGPFYLDHIENYDETNKDHGSRDQQLSLYALHGLGLVPEHVETRLLYSSFLPGLEQGKLQLWVDIFPKLQNVDIKPAVDIKPRTPIPYVLRVIIWDTTEVELQETSITGDQMSDIYVKGWIDGIDEKQRTDYHYRSLNGEGNFNWRMCFPISILPIENQLVVSKKEKFHHLHKTTQKLDPKLKIQIWDNDKFSPDDFLGTRTLALNDLPKPCKTPRNCASKDDPSIRQDRSRDYVDFFHCGPKSVRGWYACWKDETNKTEKPGGKVDLQIELLTETQAKDHPAGLGRSDPNQHPFLPEPDRPKTSFLWFASPFKTMRFIVWRHYKWYIIGFIITVLLVLLILLFVYNVPGYSVKKLFGA